VKLTVRPSLFKRGGGGGWSLFKRLIGLIGSIFKSFGDGELEIGGKDAP